MNDEKKNAIALTGRIPGVSQNGPKLTPVESGFICRAARPRPDAQ